MFLQTKSQAQNAQSAFAQKVVKLIGNDVIVPVSRFDCIANKRALSEVLSKIGYRFYHESNSIKACYIKEGVIVTRAHANDIKEYC